MEYTIFPNPNKFTKNKPFQLEFRQLKEYFNFRRKFKTDKKDFKNQGKIIQNEYYLIDKNWLNKWKEFVGYSTISSLNLNRDMNDYDYNTFIGCLSNSLKETKLYPLDNSKIYNNKGDINPLAEFVIINKECQKVFAESRQNMVYNINERSVPVKFLNDKIILHLEEKVKLICFRNDFTHKDEEIIVVFNETNNKDIILSDIEKQDFKFWLKDRGFQDYGPDELDITEQGCKIRLINKNLKLTILKQMNRVTIGSQTTGLIKYNLPNDLLDKMQDEEIKILEKTGIMAINAKNNQQKNPFHINNNVQNNGNNAFGNNKGNIINNNLQHNFNQIQNFPQNIQNFPQNIQNCPQNIQFNNNCNNNLNPNCFFNNMNNMNSCNNMNMNINNMNNPMSMNNLNNNMNVHNRMNNNIINPINNNNCLNLVNNHSAGCLGLNNGFGINPQNPKNMRPKSPNESPFTKGIIYPHPAGLMNVGQSCYMNATIECLSNIKSLSNNLLSLYGSFDVKEKPLCLSYSSLLYELFHTKEKYIEPKLFKEIIGKLNPLFEGNHAADAKDLIFFIIETLHKELCPPSNDNNNEIDFVQQELNSQNEQKMLNDFLNELGKTSTIVSNIFYGVNRSVMKCNGCNRSKYSFQTFNLLIFPLKKVKEYKMRISGFQNYNLNLYDAFLCEQEEERLEGDNMIYCNICKKLSPGVHKQDIYSLPSILIIILNRGKNNQDFNEQFTFDEVLDFGKSKIIYNPKSNKRYFLCGIITHLGESGSGGHFIAYCRNNFNDNFTCYNDAAVSQASVVDAMSTKISANEYEKKTPYILLYHYLK